MLGKMPVKIRSHCADFCVREHGNLAMGSRSRANEAWNERAERHSRSVPDKSPAGNFREHRISLLGIIRPDVLVALLANATHSCKRLRGLLVHFPIDRVALIV